MGGNHDKPMNTTSKQTNPIYKSVPAKSTRMNGQVKVTKPDSAKFVAVPVKEGKKEKPIIEEAPRKVTIKIKKKKNGRAKGEEMIRMNPWLNTLANPFDIHGVRVPDDITAESCTFSIWDHRQLQTNSNGIVSLCYGCANSTMPASPKGGLVPMLTNPSTDSYAVGCFNNNAALTTTNIFGNSGLTSPTTITFPQWNSISTTVPKLFSQVRLVSVGVSIQFTGNLLNAQGTITLVSAPRRWLREFPGQNFNIGGITLATLQSHPSVQILSIPKYMGGSVVWKPIDEFSYKYSDTQHIIDTASEEYPDECLGGELYVVVSGAVANQTFQVDACFNYEGIASTNQMDLLEPQISKFDSLCMEHTLNNLPAMPTCLPVPSPSAQTKIPIPDLSNRGQDERLVTESHPAQDSTMMEKIFDTVDEVIDRGSKIAGKLSPLLAALI